jgi:cell division transport system permease protein
MSAFGTYWTHHAQALLGSLGRLTRAPVATLLTSLVIALAFALPLGMKVLVTNAAAATGGMSNAVAVSVYFKRGVAIARVRELAHGIRMRADVAEATVIPADDALKEFRQYSGFGAALQALQDNPLPHVIQVRPAPDRDSPRALVTLEHDLRSLPEVDIVQVDSTWVQRLSAILEVVRRGLMIAAAILGLGVLAVVGNTVRLEIQNRRTEIEVIKLVGGSNRFVRRPFLYTGILYGLCGALIAWLIVVIAVFALQQPVSHLAELYGSRYVLNGPDSRDIGFLAGGGALIGWLGAWLSTGRHLRRIQPRA